MGSSFHGVGTGGQCNLVSAVSGGDDSVEPLVILVFKTQPAIIQNGHPVILVHCALDAARTQWKIKVDIGSGSGQSSRNPLSLFRIGDPIIVLPQKVPAALRIDDIVRTRRHRNGIRSVSLRFAPFDILQL